MGAGSILTGISLSFFSMMFPVAKKQFSSLTAALGKLQVNPIQTLTMDRNSQPEVFLGKGVLKICSKFTGEHPCRSVISMKLQSNFTEITLQHGCSPSNLLHIFRTPFPKKEHLWTAASEWTYD